MNRSYRGKMRRKQGLRREVEGGFEERKETRKVTEI